MTKSDCTHGDVWPIGTPLRSLGIVEVWGRVGRDGWDNNDAAVVCNQLGFGQDGNIIIITKSIFSII